VQAALVIVERQEEDEYRNEEGFKFNAVTLAIKRASLANIPVVLGSTCPSMEMYHYAENNNFKLVEKRWILDKSSQERITTPDIRSSAGFLEELIPLIREGVQAGEKIAVFTPRKDYGSYLVCHSCKKPFLCPIAKVCSITKKKPASCLSICGKNFPYKEQCVWCGSNIIRFPEQV
jgi:primosomal protein N' (replication factor Y)